MSSTRTRLLILAGILGLLTAAQPSFAKPQQSIRYRKGKFITLFNGKNLDGWTSMGAQDWSVHKGLLITQGQGGWLRSNRMYRDFELQLDFRMSPSHATDINSLTNSGVMLRSTLDGNPSFTGMEIQIIDDHGRSFGVQGCGALYGAVAPSINVTKPANQWNHYDITLVGEHLIVKLNGHTIINLPNLDDPKVNKGIEGPPFWQRAQEGYIGLQSHTNEVDFRHIRIRVFSPVGNSGRP